MVKGVIFDLDQTLIDSKISANYRKIRDWQSVYKLIPNFKVYDGFFEVFDYLLSNNIKVAIVTSSPGIYAEKVIGYFQLPCDHLVDYFKVKPVKPNPAPMLMASNLLNLPVSNIISFGDRKIDIQASNSAKIRSVACLWDSEEMIEINEPNPTYKIRKPIEIIAILKNNG